MVCSDVQKAITISSRTEDGSTPLLANESVSCQSINDTTAHVSKFTGPITGQIPSAWKLSGILTNVSDGVHTVTIANVTTQQGNASTNSVNHFLFRIGQKDNPMVFPRTGNYSSSLLHQNEKGDFYVSHKAAGADKFRYSLNWGSTSWSDWQTYDGGNYTLKHQAWSGTKAQEWSGKHVIVQYWSQKTGSSNHQQEGDLAGTSSVPRRLPHAFIHG